MATRPDFIFIVGLPRTGTTLTRSILNCSPAIGISKGESHFMGDRHLLGLLPRPGYRQRFGRAGDLKTDGGAHQLVDFLYTARLNGFWAQIPKTLRRDECRRRLLASDRSDWALLELAMEIGAQGKPVRGEKTPAHVYSIAAFLERFPNAKVIHTMRDPRAVYVSNTRKYDVKHSTQYHSALRRTGLVYELYASLEIILNWQRVMRLHHRYQADYSDRYAVSRYEDLVRDPKGRMLALCDFVGVEFTDAMLRQTVINSSFIPRKGQVQGFDTSTLERWRKALHPAINRWFLLWCGRQLADFGYQP